MATAALIYVAANPPPKPITVGVNVGDIFTYNITSTSTLIDLNAVETPGFFQYNQTDFYRITITDITGTNVSMNTLWVFKNGTQVKEHKSLTLLMAQIPIATDSGPFTQLTST